jgi:hypothetical protein
MICGSFATQPSTAARAASGPRFAIIEATSDCV